MARFPVDKPYTITQGFGMTAYAKKGAYGGGPHTGVDITKYLDAPIYEPVPVVDEIKGWEPRGYGHYWVGTTHDGYEIFLAHMNRHGTGKIVGYMGTSGFSSGVHTHFEVRKNGRAINPITWLSSRMKGKQVTEAEAKRLRKQLEDYQEEFRYLLFQVRLGRIPSAKEIKQGRGKTMQQQNKEVNSSPEHKRFRQATGRSSAVVRKEDLLKK